MASGRFHLRTEHGLSSGRRRSDRSLQLKMSRRGMGGYQGRRQDGFRGESGVSRAREREVFRLGSIGYHALGKKHLQKRKPDFLGVKGRRRGCILMLNSWTWALFLELPSVYLDRYSSCSASDAPWDRAFCSRDVKEFNNNNNNKNA